MRSGGSYPLRGFSLEACGSDEVDLKGPDEAAKLVALDLSVFDIHAVADTMVDTAETNPRRRRSDWTPDLGKYLATSALDLAMRAQAGDQNVPGVLHSSETGDASGADFSSKIFATALSLAPRQ